MSYEGYEQVICKSGHYYSRDCYSECKCNICSAEDAWTNAVDCTNCDSYGLIPEEDMKKFIISPEVVETCNLGHKHIVAPATYRVPTKEEQTALRTYEKFDGSRERMN